MSIRIDKEFESLIPPLTADEFKQLEENCVKDGIRDPLVVWRVPSGDDILIDGHNRWKIAAKHGGIQFETVRKEFDNRNEVIVWICKNQLGRRNLHPLDAEKLRSRERQALEDEAQKRMKAGVKADPVANFPQGKTRDIIGKEIGVSGRQVDKLHRINEKASESTKQAVRDGKLSVNQAYNSTFPKRPDPVKVAKEEHERFKADGNKIVDIQAAKVDQINQKIIDNTLTQEVLKLLGTIERFGFEHKAEELKALQTELADDAKANMQGMIKNCHMILDGISNAINRR